MAGRGPWDYLPCIDGWFSRAGVKGGGCFPHQGQVSGHGPALSLLAASVPSLHLVGLGTLLGQGTASGGLRELLWCLPFRSLRTAGSPKFLEMVFVSAPLPGNLGSDNLTLFIHLTVLP